MIKDDYLCIGLMGGAVLDPLGINFHAFNDAAWCVGVGGGRVGVWFEKCGDDSGPLWTNE